ILSFSYTVAGMSKEEINKRLTKASELRRQSSSNPEGHKEEKEKEVQSTSNPEGHIEEKEKEKGKEVESEQKSEKEEKIDEANKETARNIPKTDDDNTFSVMKIFDGKADKEEQMSEQCFVCELCHDVEGEIGKRYMFFHAESFDMHNDNHHKTTDRAILKHYKRKSYICNVNKCYLFFSSYEQQLDHRMCHQELYCKYCNQFIGSIKKVRDHIISCGAREEPRQKRSRG
ncbi:MAG: hypothetical protein MJE68_19815, partial [Proteobacteria bacterium]|nr:hypothetical protein [Pseudomonadota bacterium]